MQENHESIKSSGIGGVLTGTDTTTNGKKYYE